MSTIHPWLILSTASLLRGPKLVIVVPILSVFLLAYNAVYDFSLRPLNGGLVAHFNNFTLHDGTLLTSPTFLHSSALPTDDTSHVVRLTFEGENTLRYPALCDLLEFQHLLQNSSRYILSPVSSWPVPLTIENPTTDDEEKVEKYILKTLNLDQNHELTTLFFDRLGKKNHLVHLAGKLHIYVFYDPHQGIPDFTKTVKRLRLVDTRIGHASLVQDFKVYYQYLRGELLSVSILTTVWTAIEVAFLGGLFLHVFLSICNQHKIRSNVGLMIGWLTETSMAAFASLCIIAFFSDSVSWTEVFGPLGWRSLSTFFIVTLVLSSRNLFRTINDLAGDNAFGAPENLHRRVIKYYLGINSSVQNSQGVYRVSRLLRKIFLLDYVSAFLVPIPNTTVILLVNLLGISALTVAICLVSSFVLEPAHNEIFTSSLRTFLVAILIALVLDHFLQLTFLVGIIVIDLNRVDLTDLLNKSPADSPREDSSAIHEVNPISSVLLGLHGEQAAPNSLRYRLGTYFLKISPVSTKRFWTTWVPLLSIPAVVFKFLLLNLAVPISLADDPDHVVTFTAEGLGSQTYDFLFYSELFAIVVFVIAVSQLTFTLTYSKRQRKEIDSDEITALISPDSGITNAELAKGDEIKFFESITLSGTHESDILKLQSNPKCSFLVSTGLDHKLLIWSPLSKVERGMPQNISTFFESADEQAQKTEFWPINHIEISDDGNYIVLINNKHCRIKCFDRKTLKYVWEVSLTSELNQSRKKMQVVTAFFRKRTVAGFLARKLLLKKKAHRRRNSAASIMSATTMTGNYPPPSIPEVNEAVEEDDSENRNKDYEDALHREEFVVVLESGEMVTIACDDLKIKVYNLLTQIYEGQNELLGLKIISLKLLKTARVNDRIICNLSNDDIIVGTAVNNIWRFNKLEIDAFFSSQPPVTFAPPLMSRTGSAISLRNDFSTAFELQRQNYNDKTETNNSVFFDSKKYAAINQSAIITIDFVGMVVRVKDLQAQLVDIQTGTIVKVFDIGHFKPGTFRVVHSEPTHCKFCGCASFESLTLVYQDFYEKMLILQTFSVENKKSRNNICLRVERDPREIRCVGFDSVIEKHYWYDSIEMWEVTDMNVIVGIRKNDDISEEVSQPTSESAYSQVPENGFSSLRSRKSEQKPSKEKRPSINDLWQGFVITAQNGKLLEYSIPEDPTSLADFACTRPNCIVKYGYKSVAIAFGKIVKILFLGGDKLIENDLYYSGTTSTLNGILKPSKDGVASSNELLFINKRRRMLEKRTKA